MRKRQRVDMHSAAPGPNDVLEAANVNDNAFIADNDAMDSAGDDDDDDDKPKTGQKQGRRKIKIEFIQDKSRRHITFSKRKAGIMKKAYELSTLTGTQVLLLVVSETGLVYTFTTAKLQPLVTQPEGKNLIQACLNAPHGTLPSSMPVGQPLGRSSGPMGGPGGPPVSNNMPGGLSISGGQSNSSSKDDDDANDDDDRVSTGDKRRRRSSTTNSSSTGSGAPAANTRSATANNSVAPPPLSIPSGAPPQHSHSGAPSQIALGSPTSPQQQHQPPATSPAQYSAGGSYHHPSQQQQQHHQPQHDSQMGYPSHLMSPTNYSYAQGGGGPPQQPGSGGQPLGGLAAAAAQHSHWGSNPQGQVQGGAYGRR
ncbi:SRF-type transcription factor (DNA-binding and dimerization domain)-domain-containing protein [Favolaschia claudopus]|uniref:SRF-type transcription factor (DNA-binding and dimerization domain)-domain-containing protein n=1 Tax=Favolaschia claudopus TaxID=2862362 RepID=A0AAW0DB25_9AGAR